MYSIEEEDEETAADAKSKEPTAEVRD